MSTPRPSPTPAAHRSRRWLPALVLGLGLAVVACSTPATPAPQEDASPPNRARHGADFDSALGHVHGMGVNPADELLYVASHFGVFRFDEDGTPTRIADRWQDTMSFTVVGPDTFIGSGHPDPREDLPPHLGLVESRDAARTWRSVSLLGEADFHALAVAGSNIFGFDTQSGRLLVSDDRKTWSTVAPGPIIDLAWLGNDPDAVLGTTPAGLVEFRVGAPTRTVASAPPLVFIESPVPGELVGVTAAGELYSATDIDAGEWVRSDVAVAGTPEALTATPATWYVATGQGIFASVDRGGSWTTIHEHADSALPQ